MTIWQWLGWAGLTAWVDAQGTGVLERAGGPLMGLICICLPFATFGLVTDTPRSPFDQPVVVDAPPIARYAMGWSQARALDYFTKRGARIVLR